MSNSKNRDPQIDVMRGIAILLVIWGHSISGMENPVNRVILSFHMPLFFFISGLCYKERKIQKNNILQIIKSLVIPMITFSFISTAYYYVIDCVLIDCIINHNTINIFPKDVIMHFIKGIGTWFLCDMLYVKLVSCFVPLWNNLLRRIINGVCLIIMFLISLYNIELPFYMSIFPFCFFFFLIGIEYRNSKYFKKPTDFVHVLYLFPILVILASINEPIGMCVNEYGNLFVFIMTSLIGILIVLVISASLNEPVGMYMNQYGNILLFIINSLIGILMILIISNYLKEAKILSFCGKNSMIIYVIHFSIWSFFATISWHIPYIKDTYYQPYFVLLCIIVTVLPTTLVLSKYCPILFGMKKS